MFKRQVDPTFAMSGSGPGSPRGSDDDENCRDVWGEFGIGSIGHPSSLLPPFLSLSLMNDAVEGLSSMDSDNVFLSPSDGSECVVFTQKDLPTLAMPLIEEIRRTKKLCDVVIKVREIEFKDFKVIFPLTFIALKKLYERSNPQKMDPTIWPIINFFSHFSLSHILGEYNFRIPFHFDLK